MKEGDKSQRQRKEKRSWKVQQTKGTKAKKGIKKREPLIQVYTETRMQIQAVKNHLALHDSFMYLYDQAQDKVRQL